MGTMTAFELVLAASACKIEMEPQSQGGGEQQSAPAEELAALARCAEMKAEAKLLAALAAHHLALAEVEMRRFAEAPCSWDSAADQASGQAQQARRVVHAEGDATPSPEFLVPPGNREGELVHELAEVAVQLLAASRTSDLEATLKACTSDPQLRTRAQVTAQLLAELKEQVVTLGGNMEALETAIAPAVPHVSDWWRTQRAGKPLFLDAASPCPGCLDFARLTWQRFQRARVTETPAPRAPQALLERHAAAFRVWALAQHRLLAAEAIIQCGWGALLLSQQWSDAHLLALRNWRSELSRHQVGQLAQVQHLCAVRARNFLHPLGPEDVEFLRAEDLNEQAELMRDDLRKVIGESATNELAEHRVALGVGGALAFVLQGLQASVDALRTAPGGTPPAFERQVAVCTEVEENFMGGAGETTATRPRIADIDRRAVECWGTLSAVERLKSFC